MSLEVQPTKRVAKLWSIINVLAVGAVGMAIAAGRIVQAMLLLGPHEDGTSLDPDERKTIRNMCSDAGVVYGHTVLAGVERSASLATDFTLARPAHTSYPHA